jgi:hypothetical protein
MELVLLHRHFFVRLELSPRKALQDIKSNSAH